jgi:hypothetical protein
MDARGIVKTWIYMAAMMALACFGLFLLVTPPTVQAQSTPSARTLSDQLQGVSPVTCADNGGGTPAACNLGPNKGTVTYTCSDADGCTVTMTEVGAYSGELMRVVNISANVATVQDTAGVAELAGNDALGQWDSLSLVYVTDRWVELGRSNN